MDNKVRLVSYKREQSAVFVPNRYEYNPKGRLLWLQKLLFKVLRYLHADSYDTSVAYKHIDVDTSSILNALMRNQRDVEMLYNRRARYVVMGPEDFARFCNEREMREFQRFNFTAQVGRNRMVTAMGLEVVIVPWIQGFFVLPELNGEHSA